MSFPASVANANARMSSDITDDRARAMTARANALLMAGTMPARSRRLRLPSTARWSPPTSSTRSTARCRSDANLADHGRAGANQAGGAAQAAAASDTSTWDQTSLIGKIFIAFGALLTIASAARMFMA